jgi:predicted transposase YbfD/YdcC
MGTQKKIAKTIIDKGGDYILALKENHKTLYEDTEPKFQKMKSMEKEGYTFDENTEVDGGCRFRSIDLLKISRLITMIFFGNRKAGRLSFLPAFIM